MTSNTETQTPLTCLRCGAPLAPYHPKVGDTVTDEVAAINFHPQCPSSALGAGGPACKVFQDILNVFRAQQQDASRRVPALFLRGSRVG